MSDLSATGQPGSTGAFGTRAVALMLAIGILSFVGMLLLGAYAPDLRSGHDGGAHALSNSATGYSGLVRLASATGRHPRILRSTADFDSENLLVLTPTGSADDLPEILKLRYAKATLVVLPKWVVTKDPVNQSWVRRIGIGSRIDLPHPLDKLTVSSVRSGGKPLRRADHTLPSAIAFTAPRPLQVMTGPDLDVLITDERGRPVLARIGGGPLYVLSDPDLLSNRGMKDIRQAGGALALLDWLNTTGADSIDFDVTLNGLGHSQSPLKLAFNPPFLAMTLAIAITLLLAALYALVRFGAIRHRDRAIAFGKAALVDNSAAMIRKAGREARIGRHYAALIRDRAIAIFGVPPRLRDAALDAYLDGLAGDRRFTEIRRDAEDALRGDEMLEAAQALHGWMKEKTK